jgi:hypothetical protein
VLESSIKVTENYIMPAGIKKNAKITVSPAIRMLSAELLVASE